jgi:DNA polymerase-1
MVVGRSNFEAVLARLQAAPKLSLDTETTGLRPYHGDRLFSVIIAIEEQGTVTPFYFNFQVYEGVAPDWVLTPSHLGRLKSLCGDASKVWYLFNAKYDMHILAQEGIVLAGTIHCGQAIALVEYNEHQNYDLASCAERIGFKKDDTVERYIEDHDLKETRQGATQKYTHKFYDRVPFDIIAPYGETDGVVTYRLGEYQETALQALANATHPSLPSVRAVLENERRLTHTVFRLENVGVRIDRPYCVRAARYEAARAEAAMADFKRETGRDFKASPKLFAEVFGSEKDLWGYTDKGNPSFDSDFLSKFKNPAAKAVLTYRDAKSKANFYQGFLYHADRDDIIHPTYNPDGAAHGRFSSSNPNFQNLTSEEDEEDLAQEFVVRRAITPRPGYVFIMPDYDQVEYRMMFDFACQMIGRESDIVKKIKHEGLDPHQATANAVCETGTELSRKRAKNGNFAWLYGSGDQTFSETIGAPLQEARQVRAAMRRAAPEVQAYVDRIIDTATQRGFIFNWFGRRCYFPNRRVTYKAPNYHIAGGCADVTKIAMNRIDEMFLRMKSRMVMTVHDELPCEIHESELATAPKLVKDIMESIYPAKYLPLTAGMEWSDKSLGDKKKGFPV